MFGWGGDGSRSLETENHELRARIKKLESNLDPTQFFCIETAPCIIFGVDPKLAIDTWNQAAANLTGLFSTETVGKDLDSIFPENAGQIRAVIESSTRSNSLLPASSNIEVSIQGKESKRTVLLSCSVRSDATGKIIDTIFIGHDITERKHAEDEKIRLATELQSFIDAANAAIFGTDTSGRINEWNNQSAEITGLSKEEVMGKDFVQVLIEHEFQASMTQVLKSALEGRGTSNFEFPFFTKDRRRVDVLLNATTRRDADGAVIGVIGVGQVSWLTVVSVYGLCCDWLQN